MNHVMSVVVQIANFIPARGLRHRQFVCFLGANYISACLPCQTDMRWHSRGAVLKPFIELRNEICGVYGEKRQTSK